MVAYIFEAIYRREVINRYLEFLNKCPYDKENIYFKIGLNFLNESIKRGPLNRSLIEQASKNFLYAVKEVKVSYDKLLAYLGVIVCYYVTDNILAIQDHVLKELENLKSTKFPLINMKGLRQQTVRAIGVAAGSVLTFIPQTKGAGVIIVDKMARMNVENIFNDRKQAIDVEFYDLKDGILLLDYEKYHNKLL